MRQRNSLALLHLPFTIILLATSPAVAAANDIGNAIRGLTPAELQRFVDGRTAFEQEEEADEGLGPVFNATSCVTCHSVGATGGGSDLVETRFGTTTNGAFDALGSKGGSLIQTDGIGVQGACNYVGEQRMTRRAVQRGARIVARMCSRLSWLINSPRSRGIR